VDVPALMLAAAAAVAIFRFNIGMLYVLAGSCAAGCLLHVLGVV
jgi:chromate transporter